MKTHETAVWQQPRAIALLMAASLTVMANATISPALAGLEQEFSDAEDAGFLVRLLVTVPSLGVMLTAPLAGWLTDRAGRRGVLLAGVWLFILCGTAGFYLPDLHLMLASRFGLGIAVALIMTAQTALIGDYFTGARRQALTGLQISARNFGGLVFIGTAGLAATLSPRLPFLIYGLAAVCLFAVWRHAPEPRHSGSGAGQPEAPGHPAWLMLVIAVSALQMLTNGLFFIMPTQLPFFFAAQGLNSALMTGAGLGLLSLCGGLTALLYARFKGTLPHAAVFAMRLQRAGPWLCGAGARGQPGPVPHRCDGRRHRLCHGVPGVCGHCTGAGPGQAARHRRGNPHRLGVLRPVPVALREHSGHSSVGIRRCFWCGFGTAGADGRRCTGRSPAHRPPPRRCLKRKSPAQQRGFDLSGKQQLQPPLE